MRLLRTRTAIFVVTATIALACKAKPRPTDDATPTPAIADAAPAVARIAPTKSEVASLETWERKPSKWALEQATACDAGDAAGCYRLGNFYEEGIGTPLDREHAFALYQRACDANRGEACRILGLRLSYAKVPAERERGLAFLERACELEFLDACANAGGLLIQRGAAGDIAKAVPLLARGCRRGYLPACRSLDGSRATLEDAGIAFPSLEPLPIEQLPIPTPAQACPPMHNMTTSTGGGARLNNGIAPVPHELMLAAIPSKIRGWKEERRTSGPPGIAGTRSASARVRLAAKDDSLEISIHDNKMNCTMQPRTDEVMLQGPAPDGSDTQTVEVAGRRAIAIRSEHGSTVTLGLGNRCTVSVSVAPARSTEELVEIAQHIDIDTLAAACAKRELGL